MRAAGRHPTSGLGMGFEGHAQPLAETVLRGFYPTPYAASPSIGLATPWYLDYGHLSFWFFVGATVAIVL